VGPRRAANEIEPGLTVVKATETARQTRLLVRVDGPVLDPSWEVTEVGLEDIVLAYMEQEEAQAGGQLVELGRAQ
jgi:ABC-2 type transport system ATP-binding protein